MANEKRLVDSEAIARKLKKAHCAECNVVRKVQCSACWVNDVLELLDGNTVDAMEVVRCRECYFGKGELICTNPKCTKSFYGCPVPPDHFCSYGERR